MSTMFKHKKIIKINDVSTRSQAKDFNLDNAITNGKN